ncbi:MAG: ABC transporter ATP-binding protein [Burkholderiales bacterium]|nr:ABC transporter ATP-binding protein [Burkholderiales bacterium]
MAPSGSRGHRRRPVLQSRHAATPLRLTVRVSPPPTAAPATVVRLEGVTRAFAPGQPLFRAVDLTIRAGERVALCGESGVGKSTLLNLIAGLDVPDAGTVEVAGIRLDALDTEARTRFRRDTLGFVFQAFHLLPHLSARRNVMVPLMLAGRGVAVAGAAADAVLADLGLAARAGALPGELSGGEQQRVALARALVHKPALVLADEPTGNLDPATARGALDRIFAQCARSGATLLMVTHSPEIAAHADRRLVLGPQGIAEG